MLRIVIVGGGAAGFFAAITSQLNDPQADITLLEATKTPLMKVKISGGGRCNVTHHCFEPLELIQFYPRGNKVLRGAFTRFQPKDTIAWFESRGVRLKTEADGRIFPVTDQSETIVNCLLDTAKGAGVKLYPETRVKKIEKRESHFILTTSSGHQFDCDRLLIATGSHPSGYQWAKDLGHTIIPPVPSLFTFTIKDPRLEDLAGISLNSVELTLLNRGKKVLQQTGSLLITHWGVSGPAVLKLSSFGARILYDNNYQLPLLINWFPQYNFEELQQHLLSLKNQLSNKQINNFSPDHLPKRLWQSFLKYLDINPKLTWSELSKKQIHQLVEQLLKDQYNIIAKGSFKEEFVTCGGVNLKEIDFKTMESKISSGLFFAGEILDIDGVTGGFNFQNAWTTGWLAGQGLVSK